MRKSPLTPQQKQDQFRHQIRRRQVEQLFQVCRLSAPLECAPQQLAGRTKQLFQDLLLLTSTPGLNLSADHSFNLIIKELKQINCSSLATQVFMSAVNIQLLVQLQANHTLSPMAEVHLHQILLNISSHEPPQKQPVLVHSEPAFQIETLRLGENLNKSSGELIKLTFQIMANFLIRDQTSRTLYYLVAKLGIFKTLLKFLKEKRSIYASPGLRRTYLWFANRLISLTCAYKLDSTDADFSNMVACFYEEICFILQRFYIRDFVIQPHQQQDAQDDLCINQVFMYLRSLIPTGRVDITEELLERLEKYCSTDNPYYLNLISTIIFHTLYSVPAGFLEALVRRMLDQPESPLAESILRLVTNSLLNDGTHWRKVMQVFLEYSHRDDQLGQYGQYGLVKYFVRLLNRGNTEEETVQLIGLLICGQGGLGIFQDNLQPLLTSRHMRKKLRELGFEMEMQQDD